MKGTVLVFITLVVGTLANPALRLAYGANQERIVTAQIVQAIEDLAQSMRDAGYDPFELTESVEYELPVPVIFAASAFVDSLLVTGASNIVVHQMDYGILSSRLTFDISLPRIELVVGGSGFAVTLFGNEYDGSASGSVAIEQIRIAGNVRISIGIISGISIRSLSLNFSLGGIESNTNVKIMSYDISERLNTFLGTTIPATLNEFSDEINQLIEAIAWQVIEEIL